ncbi:MAG: DivIVA domain-containing protein [Actinomycetota bacterium]
MDISPQQIRTAEFTTVRKGLDPDEVRDFLERVSVELERAQNQSTAMEARARAAVARLQELSDGAAQQAAETEAESASVIEAPSEPEPEPARSEREVVAAPDDAETISRTLLLAQRTADTTVAEAEAEAERIRAEAEREAAGSIESAREMSGRLVDEARDEARRAGEDERLAVESEVNALKARREFLASDVEHLEVFLVDERSRIREAATALIDLTERVPGGLGEVRAPLLSASDDDTPGGIEVGDAIVDEPSDATGGRPSSGIGSLTSAPAEHNIFAGRSGDAAESSDASDAEESDDVRSNLFLRTDIADDIDLER